VADTHPWNALREALQAAPADQALAACTRAAREVARLVQQAALPPDVSRLRIAVLRSFTAELLAPVLIARLAEHRVAADVQLGQLGNFAAEALQPQSFVYSGSFDACIVLILPEHVLPNLAEPGPDPARDAALTAHLAQLDHLAQHFKGCAIVANFALSSAMPAPHLQAQSPDSGRYLIGHANRELARLAARRSNVVVFDLAALAARFGTAGFWSARDQLAAMQPFTADGLLLAGQQLADLCFLYRATPTKCIVLDCDNTLWGGILGEDGLNGIQLGESYPGRCYQQFQEQLRDLNRLGFLLALNSKNNADEVQRVFAEHPAMVLKPEHLAAQRVNWEDKVTNLRSLAQELNLGLDSFIFIDDSAFELDFVRAGLPQVRCLQVPAETWRLPQLLPEARLVDRLRVTAEDRQKARMYAEQRQRAEFEQQATDLPSFLRGLQLELRFEPFDPEKHSARAAQLTQKTNQFNLTTRRYTEAELRSLAASGTSIFLASLTDRFGEHGRIALAIVKPGSNSTTVELDVFLMSCRVIGRGVEGSFLRLVLRDARGHGARLCRAEFLPTARNVVCKDFLAAAGFREVTRDETGRIVYEYDLTNEPPSVDDWITIR